ncbi:IS701 family transposase [Cryobacterium shii]|uniref:IS701 family transposase n=4 Tax=Cryobacterium TaxID=69578 RepID=A0AAQ2C6M3_9MICO|nr:IS701 family transposase [Cryobacterium shii]TFC47443.1 IS701 family transposase [Cryobacterium shii]
MNPDELTETKAELEAFVEDVFASLPRADQRGKGNLYLRGLMLDGRRKSMQPMGERLGVDYQQLQQFVSSSPWKVEPVRRVLVRRALQLISPDAWVVDDTGFKKDGSSSPCVARQYSGTLGKIGNCQIGVSIHAATDQASCPLNWRLYVPGAWDDTCADTNEEAALIAARRAKAQLPDLQRHRTKWAMALEMIDELADWGHRPPALVGDAGYGEITAFRCGLTERLIPYMVAVKASTSAFSDDAATEVLEYSGRGPRPHQRRYLEAPSSLKDLVVNAGRSSLHQVTWRHGTKATPNNKLASMKSRFIALRVRPANRDLPRGDDGSLPVEWLLAEWPTGAPAPTDYWLSTLPDTTPLKELVRLAKIRWRIEHDYRELKTGLGLAHFEGRTYAGWHHHMTLVTAAHLFITQLRLTRPKAVGAG